MQVLEFLFSKKLLSKLKTPGKHFSLYVFFFCSLSRCPLFCNLGLSPPDCILSQAIKINHVLIKSKFQNPKYILKPKYAKEATKDNKSQKVHI